MDSKTIAQNNILIADFMGYKKTTKPNQYPVYKIPECAYNVVDHESRVTEKVDLFSIFHGDMQFNISWDWLMLVVERIENTTVNMLIEQRIDPEDEEDLRPEEWLFTVTIENSQCMIGQDVLPQYYGTDSDFLKTYNCRNEGKISKIEAVYLAVIRFIEWYNQNKKEDGK